MRTTMIAYWDMRALPVNSDVFYFMANATMAAEDAGCDWFRVVAVPGPDEGFRRDRKYPVEDHHWRFRNMVMGIRHLFPRCAGIWSPRSVEEAAQIEGLFRDWPQYPQGYTVADESPDNARRAYIAGLFWRVARAAKKGRPIPNIVPSDGAKALVRERLAELSGGRDVVTVTLREAPYKTVMNSNVDAWAAFVGHIDAERFKPVIVRDTYAMFAGPFGNALDGCAQFPEASLDIDIRAALYELAYLNLWTGNGASWATSVFNPKVRFLEFKILGPSPVHSAQHFKDVYLLGVGEQLPFFTPFQRITWEDEIPEVMVREFNEMVGKIDRNIDGALALRASRFTAAGTAS